MKVRTEIREVSADERQAFFEIGSISGKSGDASRYNCAHVYVYYHVGERPSVIVRGPGDTYSAGDVRNAAACLLAAAEWIEANVRNVVRKAAPKRAKDGK